MVQEPAQRHPPTLPLTSSWTSHARSLKTSLLASTTILNPATASRYIKSFLTTVLPPMSKAVSPPISPVLSGSSAGSSSPDSTSRRSRMSASPTLHPPEFHRLQAQHSRFVDSVRRPSRSGWNTLCNIPSLHWRRRFPLSTQLRCNATFSTERGVYWCETPRPTPQVPRHTTATRAGATCASSVSASGTQRFSAIPGMRSRSPRHSMWRATGIFRMLQCDI